MNIISQYISRFSRLIFCFLEIKVNNSLKILKKGGFYDMISTVKREIAIEKELRSKIEWACTFSNCKPKIKNGNLRMVEKLILLM